MSHYLKMFFFVLLLSSTCSSLVSSFAVAKGPSAWQQCKKVVDKECGNDLHSYVFGGEEGIVSLDCCVQLVEMGKDCHESFLSANLKSPIFDYKTNISKILERNSKIWEQCSSIVKGKSKPLKCAEMEDEKCRQQVVHSIFYGSGKVSHSCCGKLIRREKECHDSIVQAQIERGNHDYERNKTRVLEKSMKVWNKCALIAQSLPDVKSCKRKLSETCGIQIAENVLFSKGIISGKCCIQLLQVGKDCHELLALTDVALPKYQVYSKDILKRSSDAWIKCLEETEN